MSKTKDVNKQTAQAFQVGGYVAPTVPTNPYSQPGQVNPQTGTYTLPGTGIAGYQIPSGGPTGYTPYGGAAPYFQPVQFTGPQFQTALQTTNLPTFAETVGSKPGQYDELRTYVNDAGQILQIPFKDGQPIYPIPEGYRPQGDQPAAEEPTTTIPVSTTPTNQERGGDGDGLGGPTTGTLSGYPGRTGLSGLQSAFSNFGSYDLSTPPSANPYGVTGSRGFNLGTALSVASGNIFGALMSTSSTLSNLTPNSTIGAYGPTPGFTGTLDRATLDAIATGKGTLGPLDARQQGFSITQEQARNAVAASNVAGVDTITGVYGYQPGDSIPGVKDGFMHSKGIGINAKTGELTGHYSDIESFIDRMSMTREEKAQFDREIASEISVNNMKSMDFSRSPDKDKGPGSTAASGTAPSNPEDYGAMSPEDVAGMFDDETQGATGMGDTGTGGYGGTSSGVGTSDAGGGYGDGDSDSGSGRDGGGSSGGSSGGASGGCFEKGTLFKMADGTTKPIEDIKPGDKMYKGGLVYAVMQGDGMLEDWYEYKGINVTSGHPVLDKGVWKRVGETESKKAINKREVYYSLMNSNHLMIAKNGTEFTDFVEIGADVGGRSEWMMDMLNQKKAA